MGNKPWQITREAIAEAEAAEDIGNPDYVGGGDSGRGDGDASGPSEWKFDESTEAAFGYGREDGEDAPPPTPILDAYERSRDPVEMERLIQMSFDSLPERAGPQRYNHKRREHQRYRTIRVSRARVCGLPMKNVIGQRFFALHAPTFRRQTTSSLCLTPVRAGGLTVV